MLPKQLRFLHPYLHYIGLLLMVAGLPFNLLLMSLSQFFIGGNWILEGNYKEKWQRFRSNKNAWWLIGIFLMLLPGMLWTSNINEGLKLIRIDLPFLIYPFVLASIPPLKQRWYDALLKLFLLSVTLATIACAAIGLPRWMNGELSDIRQISLFISHIRFALLIALSILMGVWMLYSNKVQLRTFERWGIAIMIVWMSVFLFILQSLTGIAILLVIALIWGISSVWKRFSLPIALFIYSLPIIAMSLVAWQGYRAWEKYSTPNPIYTQTLPSKTIRGNTYTQDRSLIENGHYVNSFVCDTELREAWQHRSQLSLDSADAKGHSAYMTLIRFLNSKGLRKDKEGVEALSEREVRFVEQGVANVNYTGLWGIKMRFYQLLWELDYKKRGGNKPVGHTIMMKLEFWKTALSIIQEHPFTGVGTGDIADSFKAKYKESSSWLDPQWWMTSHNHYLYILVGFGIPGLLAFVLFFFGPFLRVRKQGYLPMTFFFSIAAFSMLTEDTLTTQAGVSFVAFFYCLFLFARPLNNTSEASSSSSDSSSVN